MARSHSDRPPELMNILVRQGCDRIIGALQTLGTPVYGTFKLSQLRTAYEKMFKKELNDLQFYYYFDLTEFIDVVELHLADVFDFQCPVDHIDPVLINKFGVEEEKLANVRLQTNVKFLGSPPYNNVQRSPGRGGKTWINSKFNNVTPPRPQQPQPPPLMGSSSPQQPRPPFLMGASSPGRAPPPLMGSPSQGRALPPLMGSSSPQQPRPPFLMGSSSPNRPPPPLMGSPSPSRGYTVDRSPTILTINDRRDYYRPVSPEQDLALPAPNFNNASPNRPQHQQRRDFPAGPSSSVRRLDFSSTRQQFQGNQNQVPADSFPNMSPSNENRQPNSSPRPTQVPVRRFTKPIPVTKDSVLNNNAPKKASDAPVNRPPMPAPSSMRPIPMGDTTPTKLTGSNAVPMGNRFTKRIETTPSKVVPVVASTDKIVEDVQMESTVSSTSSSVYQPPVLSPVNKRLTKKLPINKDQKEGDSSDSTIPRQTDYGAAELVTLFPKLSLHDQDGDDELTDAIKPAPVPFSASSEESEPIPSDDATPTKAVAEPKPLITTKSPNRAQAVLAQFAPRPVPTLNSFAGIRPMVLRNRNRSPSEFSVMSQQVVPFPKKKQAYTASAHRDHAVYTDDDE